MIKFISYIVVILLLISFDVYAWHPKKSHIKEIHDSHGEVIATIEWEYLGKRPKGDFSIERHDYINIDTDFYNIRLKYVYSRDIYFVWESLWGWDYIGQEPLNPNNGVPKDIDKIILRKNIDKKGIRDEPLIWRNFYVTGDGKDEWIGMLTWFITIDHDFNWHFVKDYIVYRK